MTRQKQRLFALLACAAILLATACSVFFLEREVSHVCTGEDCTICAAIAKAEHTLKRLGSGAVPRLAAAVLCALCTAGSACRFCTDVLRSTPITQKIRLND